MKRPVLRSLPAGIAVGLAVGLFPAFLVAAMPSETGAHYCWQIMLPGGILGLIVGYATFEYGEGGAPAAAR